MEPQENEEKEAVQEELIPCEIKDLQNGRYLVTYNYSGEPGELDIVVECQNENDEFEVIRGGKVTASFVHNPEGANDFSGKEMKKYIDSRIKEIEKFLGNIKKEIDVKNQDHE